jgi:hypothetical protein
LQADYANWLEALPENQQDSALADALRAIVELDLRTSGDRTAARLRAKLNNGMTRGWASRSHEMESGPFAGHRWIVRGCRDERAE